ncbi:TfoX/Sxy family protein [Terricaulis sp.]|uniref:TfoX/Sxy family protein n=1 Tax=Terricaulis sp. TaxID=2768686 RepID=UPI00378435BD
MAAKDGFHDFVKELFAGMGPVQIKRMFGGAGGYADGVMFLLLDNDTIHIKANDEAMKAALRAEGSGPFVWIPENGPRKGEKIDLGYWRLPEAAIDDPDEAVKWGRRALALAKAKAAEKRPKAKKAAAKKAAPKAKSRPKKSKV